MTQHGFEVRLLRKPLITRKLTRHIIHYRPPSCQIKPSTLHNALTASSLLDILNTEFGGQMTTGFHIFIKMKCLIVIKMMKCLIVRLNRYLNLNVKIVLKTKQYT